MRVLDLDSPKRDRAGALARELLTATTLEADDSAVVAGSVAAVVEETRGDDELLVLTLIALASTARYALGFGAAAGWPHRPTKAELFAATIRASMRSPF